MQCGSVRILNALHCSLILKILQRDRTNLFLICYYKVLVPDLLLWYMLENAKKLVQL